ncbi:MAG: hypothetical protein CBD08_002370 [Cellvibrionales bacterium TMED148]|nr:MAG: hypothetical protein CBD08_002370 [Cellvibrionales bacterium TMED148]
MKLFSKYSCSIMIFFSGATFAEKLELTCDDRDLVIDPDTSLLEIEAPNNTLLTPDKTFRDISYQKQDEIIKFRVMTEYYIEGWAIDETSLMAYSRLDFVQDEGLDPVKKRYACVQTPEKALPDKLPRQKVGKRPRKRGF